MLLRSLVIIVCVLAMGCGSGAPPTPFQETTTENKALAFDPASAENTLQWLAQFNTAYHAAEGDEQKADAVEAKIAHHCAALKGKEFTWVATIGSISKNGIFLKPFCQPLGYDATIAYIEDNPTKKPPKNMFPATLLVLNPVRENPDAIEPFNLEPDAEVFKLRSGNRVLVSGNVARLIFTPMAKNGHRYIWFRVSIEDYQFKPVTESNAR